jgi:endoribonuclease LACTB2
MRTGPQGSLEVYLVRRSEKLSFLGGFYAFPGGTVDPGDHTTPVARAPRETAFCGAALRELFEETGVLAVPGAEQLNAQAREAWRQALEKDPAAWASTLRAHGLTLQGDGLLPMGVWVTPPFYHITFHAQYFALLLPAGETPSIRPGELTHGVWLSPEAALAQHDQGSLFISYPVLETLKALRGLPLADVATAAAAREAAPTPPHVGGEFVRGVHCIPLRSFTLPPATHTNCFILGNKRLVVVDPGSPLPEEQALLDGYLDRLRAEGAQLQAVWLTHFHHDHIGGAEHLRSRYNIPIAAHAETAKRVQDSLKIDHLIADDTVVPFEQTGFDAEWQALATPGHAQGHLCFYERTHGHLLSGDTILGTGSTLVAPRPEGSMSDYMASLRRLLGLRLGMIFPGHGPPVAAAVDKIQQYLLHRQARETAIFASVRQPRTVKEIVADVYTDVAVHMHALAETTVHAHLEKLMDEGSVVKQSERYVQAGSDNR